MEHVTVSKFKKSLRAYLSRLSRGNEFLVTQRGRPVARLLPIDWSDGDIVLRRGVRLGIVTPPRATLPESFFDISSMVHRRRQSRYSLR
jgi:prevent-host-death family protein